MFFPIFKRFFILSAEATSVDSSVTSFEIFANSLNSAMTKSTDNVVIALIAVIVIVVTVVIYEIYSTHKLKQKIMLVAWQKFDNGIKHLQLSKEDTDLLKEIAGISLLQEPYTIIKFPYVFEKSVEKYYKIKKIETMSEEKLSGIRNLRRILNFLPLSKEAAFTSTRQFKEGERCFVKIPNAEIKGVCFVLSIKENYWVIDHPESAPQIPEGTLLFINITRPGDAEYTFNARVLKDLNDELYLEHVIKLNRAQQRNWVRMDVDIPVEVTKMEDEHMGDIFTAKIIDMSGGGLGIALPTKLSNSTKLLLDFTIPGHEPINALIVKIVRVAGPYYKDSTKIIHSVVFEGEVRSIQEQIIQYIFEKQRQTTLTKQNS